MTPHPASPLDALPIRDRLLRQYRDVLRRWTIQRQGRQLGHTVVPVHVETVLRAALALEKPPDFLHSVVYAIGEVSSAEADAALTREWPRLMNEIHPARVDSTLRCPVCDQLYAAHPMSRERDQDGLAYLHWGCDGRLVKL